MKRQNNKERDSVISFTIRRQHYRRFAAKWCFNWLFQFRPSHQLNYESKGKNLFHSTFHTWTNITYAKRERKNEINKEDNRERKDERKGETKKKNKSHRTSHLIITWKRREEKRKVIHNHNFEEPKTRRRAEISQEGPRYDWAESSVCVSRVNGPRRGRRGKAGRDWSPPGVMGSRGQGEGRRRGQRGS